MVKALAAAGAALIALPLLITVLAAADSAPAAPASGADLSGAASATARSDIPPDYLRWYISAAQTCPGLPWPVLAGIGKVESDHGRSAAPGVRSGTSTTGAEGPMQFLPGSFARHAVNADPAQPLSPYDPADAIYTAAAVLCADGATGGTGRDQLCPGAGRQTVLLGGPRPQLFRLLGLGLRRICRRRDPHRPHDLPVAARRPAGFLVPDPAWRPAVFGRIRRRSSKSRSCGHVHRQRPGHPGATGRRERAGGPG